MRAYDDEPGASRPLPLSPASLAPVRQCLDKITAASTTPELDLRDLRAALIDLRDKVEPNPSIDATVDNLSQAASAYLEQVERAAGMQTRAGDRAVARRLDKLEAAYAGLSSALSRTKPLVAAWLALRFSRLEMPYS